MNFRLLEFQVCASGKMNDIMYCMRLQSFPQKFFYNIVLHCCLWFQRWRETKTRKRKKMQTNIFSLTHKYKHTYLSVIRNLIRAFCARTHSHPSFRLILKYAFAFPYHTHTVSFAGIYSCLCIRRPHVLMTLLLLRHKTIIIKNVFCLHRCSIVGKNKNSTLILHFFIENAVHSKSAIVNFNSQCVQRAFHTHIYLRFVSFGVRWFFCLW